MTSGHSVRDDSNDRLRKGGKAKLSTGMGLNWWVHLPVCNLSPTYQNVLSSLSPPSSSSPSIRRRVECM